MADKESPPDSSEILGLGNDSGPRNSFAPNDGYQYFDPEVAMNYERRRSSLRRNSSLVTDADFKNQAYGMLRKRKSPKPNFSDKMLYNVYRLTKVYIPISSILAITDFTLDWRNAVQLLGSDKCSQKAFGSMMFSTVLIIPMIFACIHKSPEEYDMWDMIFRGCFGVSQKDPFGDVEEEEAPPHVKFMSWLFYITFSPFTHLVTQMSLHTNSAEKVEFYLEFDVRKGKVMKQLHLGCFTSYDGDELDRLKELQFRATHYVQYYIKYAKDRLRYCLIEDTLQFNIQFAMFLYNMFTAPNDHPSTFQYLSGQTFMSFEIHPETRFMADALTLAGGLITSVLMLWQGYFQIERYHEQLTTRNHIGLIRVLALCLKTMIELFLPSISLVILMIKYPIVAGAENELMLTKCDFDDWFFNMLKFYAIFLVFFSYGISFIWSVIMNVSNRGNSPLIPILRETTRMSIYTACISVKYNRIASHEESVIEHDFVQDKRAILWLSFANFIKFLPMFVVVGSMVPDSYPKEQVISYGVTNDPSYISYLNKALRYDSLEKTEQLFPPYIDVYTESQSHIKLPVSSLAGNSTKNPVCNLKNRVCFESYYDKHQNLNTKKKSGRIVFFAGDEELTKDTLRGHIKKISDIPEETLTQYRQKIADLKTHAEAGDFVTDNKWHDNIWYEILVKHYVFKEDIQLEQVPKLSATEFARYMNKPIWKTETTSELKTKFVVMTLMAYLMYTLTCITCEPRFVTSKYFRSDTAWVKMSYPYMLPIAMCYIALNIEFSAIDNQLKSFCRMYPDRVSQSAIVNFGLNEPFDCVNGKHFQSVRRCSYGTVCFYESEGLNITEFGLYQNRLKRLSIFNNPMALREEFHDPNFKGTPKKIDYVESGLIEIYKRLRTEPKLRNVMCLVNQDIQKSQFGDVFYDTRTTDFKTVDIGESEKCQGVLGEMASFNLKMENFFSATYTTNVTARVEALAVINKADEEFWSKTTIFEQSANSESPSPKLYLQHLKNHLNKELECYKFTEVPMSVFKRKDDKTRTFVDDSAKFDNENYSFFNVFHESCSTGFRRCVGKCVDEGKFIESQTAKYLIKQLAEDATKSFLAFSPNSEEKPVLINWPEQITLSPMPNNTIIPMITTLHNFNMDTLEHKIPIFSDNTDMDSKHNLPLFNPYYNYAFDVYGTSTIRDLHSIPFHRMGEALNEIHDNVGPWMIPYEPPNVGPAMTNSLPAFRLKNDGSKLIGRKFEVDIINMPRHLRLDTSSSLWHYYIHAILFPFSAPLPWWTTEKDENKKIIQEHNFTVSDAFMDNKLDGQTLYRQVSPIISFLYTDKTDKANPISNSYFNVPIWSNPEEYGDLSSTKFSDWKVKQKEHVTKQNETDPWQNADTTDNYTKSEVDSSLDSACAINFEGEAKIFGVGPSGPELNMLEDTFKWDKRGYGNRKRFRIDEDYIIYGPGGEGLKRTKLNPVVMQYQFDNKLRDAIRSLTYHDKNASKNYDDGMGYAIDDAITKDNPTIDLNNDDFKVNMTYYLFTNLMTHMWPKDYDYRYIMPYSYDFDVGAYDDRDIEKDYNRRDYPNLPQYKPGVDIPLTLPCKDGEYEFILTGKKMWCIGGPIAFDPNTKPENAKINHNASNPYDLRDVTLGRVYKPQADFIRDNTDFFPFMDLGNPFINQTFVDSHAPFGLLHKFWDTPSRLKIYSTTVPYSHYKKQFSDNTLHSPPWYKPYVDLAVHHKFNLDHVNTYVAEINVTGTIITDYWEKYAATNYHAKIKAHKDSSDYSGSQISQRMSDPIGTILPVLNDREKYDIENWQRLYTRKNKVSLNPGWHFFGREWDFVKYNKKQINYKDDDDFLEKNDYNSEILDMDYSLYNVLPNSPTYVRTSSLTDREAECFMNQPIMELDYRKPIATAPGGDNRYCEPNMHYVIARPNITENIAKTIEEVQHFNPAAIGFDEKKTYTDFNYGDLHISKPCLMHGDKAYIFAQVRRLKPFYYFYCDKWINDMQTQKVNLANDGGKISTRPCSKRILDPLNRFQVWDTNPQTAFANRNVTSDAAENADLMEPFILTDPEVVVPYSLVFTYNGTDFDTVTVLPSGISPRRGSCISSIHYGASGTLMCFGGIIKGRVTNVAMALLDGEWKTSNDKSAGFISEMAMPIPLIDHTVIEVGKKLYIFGGKTLLKHFRADSQDDILTRGHDFMQYGYRKDFPLGDPLKKDPKADHGFVHQNTPFKAYHKVSGEQQYPPIFGPPEDYGILGHGTAPKRLGDEFSDFGDSYHIFVFTGLAAEGGTGWQKTKRPLQTKKWGIHSTFYKRNYAYIFTPGGSNGIISRYNVERGGVTDIKMDPIKMDALSADGLKRKRRSLNYVKEMQAGKYNPNTGPFLDEEERKMLYESNRTNVLPNDWSAVMSEFFASDYNSGQMCKMCDGASRTLSFMKIRNEESSPFKVVETPDKELQITRAELSFVMEIDHKMLNPVVTTATVAVTTTVAANTTTTTGV